MPMLSRSWTTTEEGAAMSSQKKRPPIHPGAILADELREIGVTMNRLAKALHVSPNRIGDIVAGKRGITAETALRLSRYFGTSPEMWINLQAQLRSGSGARQV